MTDRKSFVFKFEDFEVREREFLLARNGEDLPVEPKAFRVLLFLLRNPKRLVTKDELLNAVWSDSAVTDNSLTRSIATLRRLLGDDSREPKFIANVPRLGYRFICDVTATEETLNGFATPKLPPPPPDIATSLPVITTPQPHTTPAPKRISAFTIALSLAALGILLLAIFTTGFLLRRATRNRAASQTSAAHLATEERITSNPPEAPVEVAVISRDGKYLAFFDNRALYYRQIDNGETRAFLLPQNFIAVPDDWFPDNTHLLVTRIEVPDQKASLWKISLLGGNPVKLIDNAGGGASVSPDGSRIIYRPGPYFGSELWIMDSDGANRRKIAIARKSDLPTLGDGWIQRTTWSPDGSRVAYVEAHLANTQADPVQYASSLITLNVTTGDSQLVLKDDPRLREAVYWNADGRLLYSCLNNLAIEREDAGVNAIPVDQRTGKATGPPLPLTEGQGEIGTLSATSDGKRLVVSRSNESRQVFITESTGARHTWGTPRRLTLDMSESLATAWTADNKAVLFISDRNGVRKLFKQNIDQTTAEVFVEGRNMRFPRLSADGTQVLYLVDSDPGPNAPPASLMAKPLAGGPAYVVLRENGINNYQCARTPSHLCVFSKLVGNDHVFVSFDLDHGAGREITRIPENGDKWTLSADGSRLAIVLDNHRIRYLSTETGAAHDVTLNDWPIFNVDWSSDNRTLFIRSITPQGAPVIVAFDESGKSDLAMKGEQDTHYSFFIQSPNGRYAILEMPTSGDNNAWMVENY